MRTTPATPTTPDSAAKFDPARAADYGQQSRIALAGYDACHELAACVLAAALAPGEDQEPGAGQGAGAGSIRAAATGVRHILVAGAGGTASEILTAGRLESSWRFTAVDPSPPMLDLARASVRAGGLEARTEWVAGTVAELGHGSRFDAATLIGVLHHVRTDAAKLDLLRAIAAHLPPGAPFILAGNCQPYASQPLLLAAWGQRWRLAGAAPQQVQARLGTILSGAEPPASEAAIAGLLAEAGFGAPLRFFSSLFWGAWVARRV